MPSDEAIDKALLYIMQAYRTATQPSVYCPPGEMLLYHVYKIGTSQDPYYRLRKLAVPTNDTKAPPKPIQYGGIRLVHIFRDSRKKKGRYGPIGREAIRLEHFLHKRFHDRQLNGEWLYLLPEEVANLTLGITWAYMPEEHRNAEAIIQRGRASPRYH